MGFDRSVTGTTARLRLEPLEVRHAAALFLALDDERVGRFIGGPDVTTLSALEERIEFLQAGPPADRDEVWGNWAVVADGRVMGRIEATVHHGVAEVAYLLGPGYWGRGYATEAIDWLVRTLGEAGVTQCWAAVTPGNAASIAVVERLGFAAADPPSDVPLWSFDPGDLTLRRTTVMPTAAGVAELADARDLGSRSPE
jgi:RimJ/RimL family protein N-acetyltransferase